MWREFPRIQDVFPDRIFQVLALQSGRCRRRVWSAHLDEHATAQIRETLYTHTANWDRMVLFLPQVMR